jgi:excisionase family DNA binding protein
MTAAIDVALLKPAEVCKLFGVSRTWVYDAAADGRLPSIRFVRSDLEGWLEEQRAAWTPSRRR